MNLLQAFLSAQAEIQKKTGGISFDEERVEKFYLPLIASFIQNKIEEKPFHIGIQGSQGVGKTTLTHLIVETLKALGHKAVGFSIDDFYLSYSDRKELASRHFENPFFQKRGMPGTHYIEKLKSALHDARNGLPFEIPVFDKSLHQGEGDLTEKTIRINEKIDFIILEGWCVNLPLVEDDDFTKIISGNEYVSSLFDAVDSEQKYYRVVLEYLKSYQEIWELIDHHSCMLGGDICWIEAWRKEQEEKLIAMKGSGMRPEEVTAFIAPYIPFTWLYFDEEMRANMKIDSILKIGQDHSPESLHFLT